MSNTETKVCHWKHDDDTSSWDTTCDNKFQFTNDGPKENGMKFCPYCGGTLKVADGESLEPSALAGTEAVGCKELLAAAIKWLKDTHNDEVNESWTWKQLQESGFDSLDQVELFMAIEEECNWVVIEDTWIEDLERKPAATLKEMAEVIATHLSS